jgi:hypothetical protein
MSTLCACSTVVRQMPKTTLWWMANYLSAYRYRSAIDRIIYKIYLTTKKSYFIGVI